MLEYFTYKKVKKHQDQKAEQERLDKEKAAATTVAEAEATAKSEGTSPPLPKRPEAFSEGAPILDREDEKFLERLASEGASPPSRDGGADETPPPLPPRVKTPIFDLDSDTSSTTSKGKEITTHGKDKNKGKDKDKGKAKDKGKENKRTSIDGKPHKRFSFVANIPRSISLRRKPAASASAVAVTEEEVREEETDMARVLDDLDLSARNNRAFSLSRESADMARRFTQVLRDLVGLLEDRDGALARNYEKLPRSLKKLVAQLPEKLTSSLAPELLAAAAEAQGLSSSGGGDAKDGGIKGAAKRLLTPANLQELVTKPGAVAGLLKGIVNALKTRWPAFMGTNVLWSVAVFLLLSALWYCYKRGREERLEREAAEAAEGGGGGAAASPIDGRDRIEELPDDPQLPAPEGVSRSPAAAEDKNKKPAAATTAAGSKSR